MHEDDHDDGFKLRQRRRWHRAFLASLIAVFGSAALMVALPCRFNPFMSRCGNASPRNSCIANLKQLDGAKQTWALENKKTGEAVPRAADLFGPTLYLREKPSCPSGGAYLLGRVSRKPRCTVPGHTL